MLINKNRDFIFDIAKGIGIMLVVLGHCGFTFTNFIYLFHVTLFFIISGYFFNEKYSDSLDSLKELILKKFKTLYKPFVLTNLLIIALHNTFITHSVILLKSSNSPSYNFKHATGVYWGIKEIISKVFDVVLMNKYIDNWLTIATWFLKALFFISIIACLIGFLKKYIGTGLKFEITRGIIFILLLIFGYIMYLLKFNEYLIGTMCSTAIFFYLGILYRKFKDKLPINLGTVVCSVMVLFVCYKIYPQKISILHNFYHNPIWILFSSVSGFVLIMYLSKLLNKFRLSTNILTYIGQNTIPILCLHTLFFKLMTCLYVQINHLPIYMRSASPVIFTDKYLWILYALFGIICPILCVLIKDFMISFRKKSTK